MMIVWWTWRRWTLGLLCASYAGILCWTYARVISPTFGNGEYPLYSHPVAAFLACIGVAAPVFAAHLSLDRPSQVGFWVLYFGGLVPTIVIPYMVSVTVHSALVAFTTTTLAATTGLAYALSRPTLGWRLPAPSRRAWTLVLTAAAVLGYGAIVLLAGWSVRPIGFIEAYAVRDDFGHNLEEHGRLLGYIIGFLANALNPILIAWGLLTRRPWWIAFALVASFFLFFKTGQKSYLFGGALAFLVVAVLHKFPRRAAETLVVGAILALGVSVLLAALFGMSLPASLVARRVLTVPGLIAAHYVDFFSTHPRAWLSHSVLSWLIPPVYDEPIPRIVAHKYFPGSVDWANGNMWADAYANFGLPGVVVFTAVLGVALHLFDVIAAGKDLRLTAALLAVPMFSLTNSALLTTILSHGLAGAFLLAALLPRDASTTTGVAPHLRS